jgi:hypothetical protein
MIWWLTNAVANFPNLVTQLFFNCWRRRQNTTYWLISFYANHTIQPSQICVFLRKYGFLVQMWSNTFMTYLSYFAVSLLKFSPIHVLPPSSKIDVPLYHLRVVHPLSASYVSSALAIINKFIINLLVELINRNTPLFILVLSLTHIHSANV